MSDCSLQFEGEYGTVLLHGKKYNERESLFMTIYDCFSLLGGVSAMAVMALLSRLGRLSVYGVSIGGAAAHNCGQVAAAVLTLGNTAPLYYLPVLLGVSLFTGALTGLVSACLFRALAHTDLMRG